MDKLRRIAIVDDDSDVRIALMRLLSASDFAPESFESGAEFLKSLADQPPDCVVLDLNMPGLSGFEIHQRLAQHYPGVGVVMITGYDRIECQRDALALGASAFLLKPVDEEVLLLAIEKALRR